MCKLMEEYGDRREARGEARGKAIGEASGMLLARTKFVLNLWNSGMRDLQQIANLTNLPLEEVKKLLEGKVRLTAE